MVVTDDSSCLDQVARLAPQDWGQVSTPTHSLTHPLTPSLPHPFTHPPTHSRTHALTLALTQLLIHSLTVLHQPVHSHMEHTCNLQGAPRSRQSEVKCLKHSSCKWLPSSQSVFTASAQKQSTLVVNALTPFGKCPNTKMEAIITPL